MPTFQGLAQQGGVPSVANTMPVTRGFTSGEGPLFEYPYSITGVTKDSAGAALGACGIKLFRTTDDSLVSQTVSDANGNYVIPASNALQHYVVSYKSGAPDVAGGTVNTLVGV